MLNEILSYLRNYFEIDKLFGNFIIKDGVLTYADGEEIPIKERQYIRVVGSTFNDGIYQYFDDTPIDFICDESFNGAIWRLAIPQDVISVADEISAYRAKYESVDSPSMSPYTSESFGGYSYSKNTSDGSSNWRTTFAPTLSRYRKI